MVILCSVLFFVLYYFFLPLKGFRAPCRTIDPCRGTPGCTPAPGSPGGRRRRRRGTPLPGWTPGYRTPGRYTRRGCSPCQTHKTESKPIICFTLVFVPTILISVLFLSPFSIFWFFLKSSIFLLRITFQYYLTYYPTSFYPFFIIVHFFLKLCLLGFFHSFFHFFLFFWLIYPFVYLRFLVFCLLFILKVLFIEHFLSLKNWKKRSKNDLYNMIVFSYCFAYISSVTIQIWHCVKKGNF